MLNMDAGQASDKTGAEVPLNLYPYLNKTIFSFFACETYLTKFRAKLFDEGIARIGELVQLPEDVVFSLAPTSEGNKSRIKELLSSVGLQFGMKAPHWRSPSRTKKLHVKHFEIA